MFFQKTEVKSSDGIKRKDKRLIYVVCLAAIAVAGAIVTAGFLLHWWGAPADQWKKDTVRVTRGSVDLKISATGVVKPCNEVKISPKSTGLLRRLYVKQGQIVKKGDLIAEMDDSNLVGQLEAARSSLSLAKANYEKSLNGNRPQEIANGEAQVSKNMGVVRFAEQSVNHSQAQVKSCEAQLIRDSTNAKRVEALSTEGAMSDQDRLNATTQAEMMQVQLHQAQQELQQSEASRAQAKADLESSRQQFSLLKAGSREEDVRAAKFAMEQASGNLKYLQSQMNDTRIRAPFDGIISQKYADQGAIVTPTTSAATTSATSSSIVALAGTLELVAQVSETDMEHIYMGQPVEINANAYPDKSFHGKVNLVAPEAVVTLNVTTFEVHTTIDDDPKHFLMAGMNVLSYFEAGKNNDALVVPTACISSQLGKTGVLVPDKEGNPTFRQVKTGPTAGTKTVILQGLHEGQRVFMSLNKEQLTQQGYVDTNDEKKRAHRRKDSKKPPVPSGFSGSSGGYSGR